MALPALRRHTHIASLCTLQKQHVRIQKHGSVLSCGLWPYPNPSNPTPPLAMYMEGKNRAFQETATAAAGAVAELFVKKTIHASIMFVKRAGGGGGGGGRKNRFLLGVEWRELQLPDLSCVTTASNNYYCPFAFCFLPRSVFGLSVHQVH